MHDPLLTLAEAAAYLHIGVSTLRDLIRREVGPRVTYLGTRTPRIKLSDLNQYIDEHTH